MVALALRRVGVVRTVGSPPSADTRHRPVLGSSVANTIVLSSPQLAPSGAPVTGPSVMAAPPVIDTFLSSVFVEEPDPPAVGGKEHAECADAGELPRVELIDRAHHQRGAERRDPPAR